MTTKPHPTDAMEMPEPHKIVDAKGKKILQFDDLQLRAERIAAYNLGRESMREEAAKKCKQRADNRFNEYGITEPDTGASYYSGRAKEEFEARDEEDDECADAIRSIEL